MDAREQVQRSFGDWLRQRRRELDLTREKLARQVGCSTVTLRKLEAEERRPSKQMAERLADVLSIPLDERPAFLRFARGDPFAAPAEPRRQPNEGSPRHNLPIQLTSFIGREQEIEAVKRLLASARLVTLTGVGGAGKTRLALQVAAGLLDQYSDGVWLVELAPLADPTLIPETVAGVFGVKEQAGRPILATLIDHLRGKTALLALDNCEHLIAACVQLAQALLQNCPNLLLLATSREGLGLPGETLFVVPALSSPNMADMPPPDRLIRYEAVRLFVDRAGAALPGFALTTDNATTVARICWQLDGIPLAIELAAARVKVLQVEQVAARLNDRFRLLTGGSRAALPRHQTLQALIDWSYDLLPASERVLLRRLAVFVGGWTLAAAEAVCTDYGLEANEVLDLLTQLVNKSLVAVERQPEHEARYRLLETIRQYALAKLTDSAETDAIWRRLAEYYIELAKARRSSDPLQGDLDYYHRLDPERDNLRAALAWSRSAAGTAELGLRLTSAVMLVWTERGVWNEARGFLESALAAAGTEGAGYAPARARALDGLGAVAFCQGDYGVALTHLMHSLRLFRELNDRLASGWVLNRLGNLALEQGDLASASLRLEEDLALFRELGSSEGVARVLLDLGDIAVMHEDAARATDLFAEALVLYRALEIPQRIAWAFSGLGLAAQLEGDYERARRLQEESSARFREYDPLTAGVPWSSQRLGETALAQGDTALATTHFTEALILFSEWGDRGAIAMCLTGLAGAATLDEEPERAARLWGAAEALRQSIGARQAPATRATRERLMAAAREQLGEAAFAAAWAAGQAMMVEQAVALALEASE